jgi:hypothetical protein
MAVRNTSLKTTVRKIKLGREIKNGFTQKLRNRPPGVLFIIADLVGFLSLPFIAPVNATNYLVKN